MIIYIRLVFITVNNAPNESTVLQLAYSLLDARLRSKRDIQKLSDPVSFVDVSYESKFSSFVPCYCQVLASCLLEM